MMFCLEFLTAISDWQKGWNEDQTKRRELADKLVHACKDLPDQFRRCDSWCFRKRFIIKGELIPIIVHDEFFEGIASWTWGENFAKGFKAIIRESALFVMMFKCHPRPIDVIVNISELWQNKEFQIAVNDLNISHPEIAVPLLNFKDNQNEVVLRSTLRGSEIQQIVGISSSFDDICDMGNIPEKDREELSKKYAKNLASTPIQMPFLASSSATRNAVVNTIEIMKKRLVASTAYNPASTLGAKPHPDDLKHKIP